MRVTNQYSLPESYWRACAQQRGYTKKRISVTELLQPPQVRFLRRQHDHEIEVDCADMVDMFFGNAVHAYLERFAPSQARAEEMLEWYDEHSEFTIHGTPDLSQDGVLTDWKTTRVRALEYDKPEWEQQVNLYAWLCRQNGISVKQAVVWAFLRDYDPQKRWEDGYPSSPLVKLPMRLWREDDQWEFLGRRLHLHDSAESGFYGSCTDEDRWKRDTWAVYPLGKDVARAKAVFKEEAQALEYAIAAAPKPRDWMDWYEVVRRDGKPLRCMEYCLVSEKCAQWQAERPNTLEEQLEESVRRIEAKV